MKYDVCCSIVKDSGVPYLQHSAVAYLHDCTGGYLQDSNEVGSSILQDYAVDSNEVRSLLVYF